MACVALCFTPGVFAGDTAAPPRARIARLPSAPAIDGRLDDAGWERSAMAKLEHLLYESAAPAVETTAFLGYDDENLYVGVRCAEDGARKPAALPGIMAPETIGMQDWLEIFLMPDGRGGAYYHFLLAAGGARRQQRLLDGQRDSEWNVPYSAAAKVTANGWEAEWSIPLYVLGEDRLSEDFRLNICRVRPTEPVEYITWSPLGGKAVRRGFHDPEKFGRVIDAGKIDVKPVFVPRVADAVIKGVYQDSPAGGVEYPMRVILENQGGATGMLDVVVVQAGNNGRMFRNRFPAAMPGRKDIFNFKVRLPQGGKSPPVIKLEVGGTVQGEFSPRGGSLLSPGARCLSGAGLDAYGANERALGDPIGGGAGYSRIVASTDVEVATAGELAAILAEFNQKAPAEVAGKVIRVRSGAELDLAGAVDVLAAKPYQPMFAIPAGVTLAGDRGAGGAPGPLLMFRMPADAPPDALAERLLFRLGAGARLTGVRLRGPDCGHGEAAAVTAANSRFRGVTFAGGGIVDNCRISHFGWADVDASVPGVVVRCNELSDSAYPVLIGGSNGFARIEGNLIRWAWHAVAGSGQQGTGYEAAHNRFVHVGPGWPAHAVDMHAWRRLMRGHGGAYPYLSIAGDAIKVHHNTFEDDAAAIQSYRALRGRLLPAEPSCGVCIRGVPRLGAEIFNNRFAAADPGRACRLIDNVGAPPGCFDRANFQVFDNVFGGDRMLVPLSLETLPQIRFVRPGLTIPRIGRTWSTRDANVLNAGEKMPVELEITLMPPLQIKHAAVFAGNLELEPRQLFSGARAPRPGEIVLDAAEWAAGCYFLTVEVEDERGVIGRHSTSFAVAGGDKQSSR